MGYKYIAPDLDCLVVHFRGKYLYNSIEPSPIVASAVDAIFKEMADLAPDIYNEEIKSIWIVVPRGKIEDFMKYCDEEETQEEIQEMWEANYPYENVWHKITICETNYSGKKYRSIDINSTTIAHLDISNGTTVKEKYNDYVIKATCNLIENGVKKSMNLLRKNKYNSKVLAELPYCHKKGIVKRSDYWKVNDYNRKALFEKLDEKTYEKFRTIVAYGLDNKSSIGRIKKMTANTFFNACAIGYKACGYDGTELTPIEQYIRHSDGRDEGLTGSHKGYDNKNAGVSLYSPEEWDKWYFERKRIGGHPWEIARGGNSTHIDLFVCHDRKTNKMLLNMNLITPEEYASLEKKEGYYFVVAGSAWTRCSEAVTMYMALREAGYPVILENADSLLKRFEGDDYIGIVPRNVTPKYCESLFPAMKIIDFVHIEKEEEEELDGKIEWIAPKEAKLISK